jgi:protein TonB
MADDGQKPEGRAIAILAVGGAVVVGLLLFGIYKVVTSKNDKKSREVQVVQVIRPPPPPPENQPPPPPPPDKVDEPLPQDQPEPSPADEAAPSQQLGLDAEGGAGGDAFGLAARKGGHDIAGGGGAIFAWYTQILKDAIVDRLSGDTSLRTKKYTIVVKVWIGRDGQVQNAKLVSASGSRDVDAAVESVLTRLGRLREPPPLEMPQPISLRIVSRT